jgi:hypothetical protein
MHRILTIYPWWAAAIVRGLKPTENRSWAPNLAPGDVLHIHAGARRPSAADRAALLKQLADAGLSPSRADALLAAPAGRVVGSVVFDGVDTEQRTPWDVAGLQHWRLSSPTILAGPALSGRLGLWSHAE